jgi:hypothetical protein
MSNLSYFWFNKEIFKPLESDYKIIVLNEVFGNQSFTRLPIKYFIPGSYNLEIISKVSSIYPTHQTFTFQVVEPTGDELIFFNKFKQIIDTLNIPISSNGIFIDQLKTLHEKYPNSIYSPIIVDVLAAWLLYGSQVDTNKAILYRDEAIEKYPWSSLARDRISAKT